MAINFSGMMRGLGAGAVQVGIMMKEQAKLDWETQQMNLKYERDKHMKELEIRANKELQGQNQNFMLEREKVTEGAATASHSASMGVQKEQISSTREHQKQIYDLQKTQASSQASYQQQMLANNAAELKLKTKVYEDSTEAGKLEFRKKQAEDLVLAGVPEKAVQIYVATGTMPKLDKETIPITAADIEARRESAGTTFDEFGWAEKKKVIAEMGVKSETEARKKFQVNAVQDLMIETGRTPTSGSGSAPGISDGTVTKEDLSKLDAAPPAVRESFISRLAAKDPAKAKILQNRYETAPTGVANTSMSGPVERPEVPSQPGIMQKAVNFAQRNTSNSNTVAKERVMRENPKSLNETDLSYNTRIENLLRNM